MYKSVMASLIPDVFMKLHVELAKKIRAFSKKFDYMLLTAMESAPIKFKQERARQAVLFAQVCVRVTLALLAGWPGLDSAVHRRTLVGSMSAKRWRWIERHSENAC